MMEYISVLPEQKKRKVKKYGKGGSEKVIAWNL
jgi:hypothetical protein